MKPRSAIKVTHGAHPNASGGISHGHSAGRVDMGHPAMKERHGKNPPQATSVRPTHDIVRQDHHRIAPDAGPPRAGTPHVGTHVKREVLPGGHIDHHDMGFGPKRR